MFKLFKKKEPVYFDLENYDYSSFARDMTEEELLTVNGGKQIANTNEAVANAEVGDTLTRSDNTTVVITQADIDWAKDQVSMPDSSSGTTATDSGSSTSSTSPTNTPQASVAKRDSTPEKESSTVLENIARYKAMVGNNQVTPNTVDGKKSNGMAVTGQDAVRNTAGEKIGGSTINTNSHSHHSGTFDNPDLINEASNKLYKAVGFIISHAESQNGMNPATSYNWNQIKSIYSEK